MSSTRTARGRPIGRPDVETPIRLAHLGGCRAGALKRGIEECVDGLVLTRGIALRVVRGGGQTPAFDTA
ncbi:hypothetical protein [Burkholderia glumae]|uniref:hypothetical protein n=1 Tax=Burkholderia glumae TaxID=337 RepID=UPI003B9CF6E2